VDCCVHQNIHEKVTGGMRHSARICVREERNWAAVEAVTSWSNVQKTIVCVRLEQLPLAKSTVNMGNVYDGQSTDY
jgi:hypothetical protein